MLPYYPATRIRQPFPMNIRERFFILYPERDGSPVAALGSPVAAEPLPGTLPPTPVPPRGFRMYVRRDGTSSPLAGGTPIRSTNPATNYQVLNQTRISVAVTFIPGMTQGGPNPIWLFPNGAPTPLCSAVSVSR